jgi:AcrR family transcriptional regulator
VRSPPLAARRVFAERGFRGTTIADIADAAGVAPGSIYLYFPSKEDVFAALNQQFAELIRRAITEIPPTGVLEETVRRRIHNVFALAAKNRDLVRLVVLNTDPESRVMHKLRLADDARTGIMARELEDAMAAGAIRRADAHMMTSMVFGLVALAVYRAFVVSDGRDADAYRDICADMIASYLRPPQQGEDGPAVPGAGSAT